MQEQTGKTGAMQTTCIPAYFHTCIHSFKPNPWKSVNKKISKRTQFDAQCHPGPRAGIRKFLQTVFFYERTQFTRNLLFTKFLKKFESQF
jgi:hypothetical protein